MPANLKTELCAVPFRSRPIKTGVPSSSLARTAKLTSSQLKSVHARISQFRRSGLPENAPPRLDAYRLPGEPLFTFCSRLFTFVHDKKSSLEIRLCILTPERMSGRPVDNSRLPKLRAISTLQRETLRHSPDSNRDSVLFPFVPPKIFFCAASRLSVFVFKSSFSSP